MLSIQSPYRSFPLGSTSRRRIASPRNDIANYSQALPFQFSVKNGPEHQRPNRSFSVTTGSSAIDPRYPLNRAGGLPGIMPLSALPNMPRTQVGHFSGQGRYGKGLGQIQPSQGPYVFHANTNPSNSAPYPKIWGLHHLANAPRQEMGLDNGMRFGRFGQVAGSERLLIPPQGLLNPIDYWDVLYQMELDLCRRLLTANEPMTETHRSHIKQLEQARMAAIRIKLPRRGRKGKKEWLQELEVELHGIWTSNRGYGEDPPVIIARKQDYERVVVEEVEKAQMEGQENIFSP